MIFPQPFSSQDGGGPLPRMMRDLTCALRGIFFKQSRAATQGHFAARSAWGHSADILKHVRALPTRFRQFKRLSQPQVFPRVKFLAEPSRGFRVSFPLLECVAVHTQQHNEERMSWVTRST